MSRGTTLIGVGALEVIVIALAASLGEAWIASLLALLFVTVGVFLAVDLPRRIGTAERRDPRRSVGGGRSRGR